MIDWNDFVVVGTIDFKEDDNTVLPAPISFHDVLAGAVVIFFFFIRIEFHFKKKDDPPKMIYNNHFPYIEKKMGYEDN